MEENSVIENFEMKLSESANEFLKETAKWAYLLSIVGFVGIGLMVLLAIFAGTLFSAMGSSMPGMSGMGSSIGIGMTFLYLMLATLYFFPVYYLNKFAVNAKTAFRESDSEALTTSFEYLKSHYKFIGIMMLVIFSLYGLMFAGIFVGGIFSALS